MSDQSQQVFDAALGLPEAERALLAERLLESLEPELEELTEDEQLLSDDLPTEGGTGRKMTPILYGPSPALHKERASGNQRVVPASRAVSHRPRSCRGSESVGHLPTKRIDR